MLNNGFRQILLFILLILFLSSCNQTKKVTTNTSYPKTQSTSNSTSSVRKQVIDFGKTCKGVPYKYAGKDRRGFDCSGFTSFVLKNYDVNLSSSSSAQSGQGRKIPVNQTKPGDLIFFGSSGKVSHVALVVSNTSSGITVIHSTSSKGVIVQNITQSSYWKPRILFARDVISR